MLVFIAVCFVLLLHCVAEHYLRTKPAVENIAQILRESCTPRVLEIIEKYWANLPMNTKRDLAEFAGWQIYQGEKLNHEGQEGLNVGDLDALLKIVEKEKSKKAF